MDRRDFNKGIVAALVTALAGIGLSAKEQEWKKTLAESSKDGLQDILAGVNMANTVTCTGGELTMTGLGLACETLEMQKRTINSLVLHPSMLPQLRKLRNVEFPDGDPVGRFTVSRMKMTPWLSTPYRYNEDTKDFVKGEMEVHPERPVSVIWSEDMPENRVLIVATDGALGQVFVSNDHPLPPKREN